MNKAHPVGLSEQEVLNRLEKYGPNVFAESSLRPFMKLVLSAIFEPTVLLLLSISALYLLLGEKEEFFSLITFLFFILFITIFQEFKTEKTIKALRELSSPRAMVLRDSQKKSISARELVPGDIVYLTEGDRIAADTKIISDGPLSLDESTLTGESFSVQKSIGDLLFAGTLIVKGQCMGEVAQIGYKTELGKISKSLKESSFAAEKTPLQQSMEKMVKNISLWVIVLTVFIILFHWYRHHQWLDAILIGLTLAMAILPNELPAVLLIFLAMAAWRISKRNVLTRKIPAVEALGGISTLCFDKTGTITENKMELCYLWNKESEINLESMTSQLPEEFHELIEFGILAGPQNPFDPMEKALQQFGNRLLEQTEHLHPQWTVSREYQLTTELLAVSYAWKEKRKGEFIIGAKGATEAIIELCHLSEEQGRAILKQMEAMAQRGHRILAIAKSFAKELPPLQHDLDFEFLGLVAFNDPLRTDATEAVLTCYAAGIKLMMMTGDHPATALSIATKCGLKKTQRSLTGQELSRLSDEALAVLLDDIEVFCRMSPLDKLRVITLLQKKGEVVAMTGDGVNDAPSLKKADIGIAIGKRGTDVAREASSIVLLDDNLSSIVAAIKIGRHTFKKLQSTFGYLLTIHIPITVLSVLPVFFQFPLFFLPVHIAFLHLIIEPACTLIFEAAPIDESMMTQPPRKRNAPLMSQQRMSESLLTGSLISLVITGTYYLTKWQGLTSTDSRGISFAVLILVNLFLIFMDHSNKKMLSILAAASTLLLILIFNLPFFRTLFRFEALHWPDLLIIIAASALAGLCIYFIRKKSLFNFFPIQ